MLRMIQCRMAIEMNKVHLVSQMKALKEFYDSLKITREAV